MAHFNTRLAQARRNTGRERGRNVTGPTRPGVSAVLALALMLTPLYPGERACAATDVVPSEDALYAMGKSSYRKRCARCHGPNMVSPGAGVYDLRNFPKEDRARFTDSVNNGKNAMPSWQDVLKPVDVEALWVYVTREAAAAQP